MSTHVLNFNRDCEKIAGLCVRSQMAWHEARYFFGLNFYSRSAPVVWSRKNYGWFQMETYDCLKMVKPKLWLNVCQHSVLLSSFIIRYWAKMAMAWWSSVPLLLTSCWAEPDACFLNFFDGKHASFFEKKIESQTPFCLPMHCDLYILIGEW